jgi:hypothetical protein
MRAPLLSIVALLTTTLAAAQEPATPPPPAGTDKVAALQAQIDELRAQQAAMLEHLQAMSAASVRPPEPPPHTVSFTAAPGRGLTLTVGDHFSLSLRPRVAVRDTVIFESGQPTTNELNVKTMRLWLMGHMLSRDLQYGVQLAFGGADTDKDSPSPILDAYIDYLRLRDLHIRVGQFFVPLDRGRTTYEFAMQFPDRAQVFGELGMDRDVGIQLSSIDLFGAHGVLGYSLGVFGGEGKNHFGGSTPGFLYVARIAITPFGPFDDYLEGDIQRLHRPRLAIAAGGAYNQSTNRQRSTFGTTLQLGTFDYGHAAADLVFKWRGFSVLAEFLYRRSRQGSLTGLIAGTEAREWSRSALGWVVQAGMMLHERVELVARYDDLRAIGETDPLLVALTAATGKELGAGLNVFVNGHAFKVQTDYQYLFGDRLSGGRHALHIHLDASF